MKDTKKEMSGRLKKLLENLLIAEKSGRYFEGELSKIREQERRLREKIRKERKAISLINQAKRLR